MTNQNIYIVITQTGTILSLILKAITHKQYNHSSISLDKELTEMYSFGRLNAYNPFFGGFVHESIHYGTFKRFYKTEAVVLEVSINQKDFIELTEYIKKIEENKKKYGYNYLGLALCGIGKSYPMKRRYFCSEFVRDILNKARIQGAECLPKAIHPMDFFSLPSTCIYNGKLQEYTFQKTN